MVYRQQKAPQIATLFLLQRYQDSNLEMLESESSALPFGDSAKSIWEETSHVNKKTG